MKNLLFRFIACIFIMGCSSEYEDNQPPKLLSSNPAMGDSEVSLETEITLIFDEKVTLSGSSKILVNNQEVDALVNGSKITLLYKLKSNTEYKISIPELTISDLSGNYMEKRALLFSSEFKVVIKSSLVTSDPLPEALKLYSFLKDNYGAKTISGIMDLKQCEWVKHHTEKYPAMAGFDFIFLNASWGDFTSITDKEDWWNKGGIVTISWHWNVPLFEGSSDYSFRYLGQQPSGNETTFDISKASIPGTWEYNTVIADFNKVVGIFKNMQDKGIPVLWRPMHEAAGNWFWWGVKGAQPCIDLWRMMFNHFRDNGVRNLIWIWTAEVDPVKGTNDFDWYPGDEYVDMIGTDIYNKYNPTYFSSRFELLQRQYPDKMIALSEFGKDGHFSTMWQTGAKWSFFMSWADGAAKTTSRDHAWANADWWDDAFAQNYVLTLDELLGFK